MHILPALDLLGGRAVRLLHGKLDTATDMGDPLALAKAFADAGCTRLHVVDLSGAFDGYPVHADLIASLAQILPIQLGGGLRSEADLTWAFDLGVDRVVLGTAAITHPELLRAVPADRLVVGVDVKDGRVAVRGWAETADVTPGDFVSSLAERGVQRILCTAVSRDGTLAGPDTDVLAEVCGRGVAVIASGGVGSLDHVRQLAATPGIEAVIIGKALLTNVFSYADAVAAC